MGNQRIDMGLDRLTDRSVVLVRGSDAKRFLNDLLTNRVPAPDNASTVSAALLSPQGKLLFDMILHVGDGAYRIDLARRRATDFIKRLQLYRLRAAVEIIDESDTVMVVVDAGRPDPRHAALPSRAVVPMQTDAQDATAAYHALRIAAGVPEAEQDFMSGEVFAHEAWLDRLNGIDFAKGCYVGQEIVSRMEHRGTARSRFVHVTGAAELPPRGTELRAGTTPLGTMGSHAGQSGLALVRLDRLAEVLAAGQDIICGNQPVTIAKPVFLEGNQ